MRGDQRNENSLINLVQIFLEEEKGMRGFGARCYPYKTSRYNSLNWGELKGGRDEKRDFIYIKNLNG